MSQPSPSPRRHRLPRQSRLSRALDFARVFESRCSVADDRLVLYAAANPLGRVRLGLSVSRKLGGAVVRNRLKRLLRESFRLRQHELPAGFDYILVARAAPPASLTEYQESLCRLADRACAKWAQRNRRRDQAGRTASHEQESDE